MTEYYTAEKSKERMKIIKTYYLIDYENVGSEGFKGCEKLRETDIIHLFYTDNSRKIDLDIINDHGESKLITHKVPTGNQSADMHLGSYLGYLIGKECTGQDEECKIVVISKDTGFDHIIEFWKAEKNVKISRNEKISGKQIQTKKVYLSLGDREEKTRNSVMRQVGSNIREMDSWYGNDEKIECVLEWNKGNHFQDVDVRCGKGFLWCMGKI